MEQPIVKRCACGAQWTHAEWVDLHYVGVQSYGSEVDLELRQCPRCASTITRKVASEPPPPSRAS